MIKISVIMAIYNCENTLEAAVESLYAQTVGDWELILCEDGSTDGTLAAAKRLQAADPGRIRLLVNAENRGLNESLNRCLAVAGGEYIARMDGDDVCDPTRFEKELACFKAHPEAAVVSVGMFFYDEAGTFGSLLFPENPEKKDLLAGTPFCHAGCMVKRQVMEELGGYRTDKSVIRVEDYDLWFRLYRTGYEGWNIQECLYGMRDDQSAYRRRRLRWRINESRLKWQIFRTFRLPARLLPQVALPVVKGLMPGFLYRYMHRRRLNGK